MPLVNCPQCGFEFPPEDLVCPNCGYLYDIDEEFAELPLEQPHTNQAAQQPDYDEVSPFDEDDDSAQTANFADEETLSDESIQRGCLIGVGILCALVLVIMMIVTFVLGSNRTG